MSDKVLTIDMLNKVAVRIWESTAGGATAILDDELTAAMNLRAHAIAERDAARQEAAHWRALYEAAAGVVRKLNIDAVKSVPHDWTRVVPGDRRMLGGDFTKFPV